MDQVEHTVQTAICVMQAEYSYIVSMTIYIGSTSVLQELVEELEGQEEMYILPDFSLEPDECQENRLVLEACGYTIVEL